MVEATGGRRLLRLRTGVRNLGAEVPLSPACSHHKGYSSGRKGGRKGVREEKVSGTNSVIWFLTPFQSPLIFKFGIDYAQVIKRFGGVDSEAGRRYSPATIVSTEITQGCGDPDLDRACTSHSERLNLSLRMQIRRLTRLTNAHSKSWRHHAAMLGLYFAWYNFVRVHSTIKTTPATAQGLTEQPWTIEELLSEVADI